MKTVWIFSDDEDMIAQLLSPARELAAEDKIICAAVVGEPALKKAASLGVDKLYYFQCADNRPESATDLLAEKIKASDAFAVLFAATARGKEIAASVAARLGTGMASEISTVKLVDKGVEVKRYVYGGLAVASLHIKEPACMSIASGVYSTANPVEKNSLVENIAVPADKRIQVRKKVDINSDGVDLASASRVVCIGRGLEKEEDLALVNGLAKAIQAELACSRGVAEDYKWLPLERYLGISGVKVRADLMISVAVSGQIQHIAGIRDSKLIVAINNNENAPIFEAADYGIVGDLYELLPVLTKMLA